ncbi:phosphoethanolamine--lipid A transferase [Massilia dura]|uniref:Phosphoethanolamine--lipid A transferase n=1 Tax=Pseudoduganella dura TaxID=321982 RepID=A0A6I3XQ31_9BURK|nr:phosphoethanolamine--lipid A transferase [Pseudoduganella dura]MUI15921.1 phosphoethanolamine--lipid A transferase [Pseudoduganella dura]GGX94605.1 phosphoethanolamine--lipid A transferase EptA [Pseudoduganella dura]
MPIAVSVYTVAVFNMAFWNRFFAATEGLGWLAAPLRIGAALALSLAFAGPLHLFNFRPVLKPLSIALLVATSVVSHFTNHYGVGIDWAMVQNMAETDVAEAGELLTFRLAASVAVFGILPAYLIGRLDIRFPPLRRQLPRNLIAAGISLALAIALVLVMFRALAPVVRENRDLRFLLAPTNYIHAVNGYLKRRWAIPVVVSPFGVDARRNRSWGAGTRRTVTVIVLGETARAANFSLNGYGRDTNPRLARQQRLINFPHMESCGTATAVSVPCVFSGLGREHYTAEKARSREGLLDVLQYAGFEVLWRNNNSGCKGVCDRVTYEDVSRTGTVSQHCDADGCHDGRLLEGLGERILGSKRDMVIVLHQQGSHGPAYWKRYPRRFGQFGPICDTGSLSTCSREAIVATYDNTILYTDFFLSATIDLLKNLDARHGIDTAFMYFSDHGESLGEDNIYLHGAPFAISPKEQRQVPFMLWLSDGFSERFALDEACLRQRTRHALTHDFIFHSTLGMLAVDTSVRDRDLDIFASCKPAPAHMPA